MSSKTRLMEILGVDNADEAFNRTWKPHVPSRSLGVEGRITSERQRRSRQPGYEKAYKGLAVGAIMAQQARAKGATAEEARAFLPDAFKNLAPEKLKAIDASIVGGNTVGGLTPLVFDPDIIRILKDTAPILELIPEEGQAGFKAVVQRIDTRDKALGFRSEAEALDLTGETNSDIHFGHIEVDMKIWVDKVSISDFSRLATAHYVDIRDTVLGERVAQHAQEKEINLLYADPSLATASGSFGDADGYEGFADIIEDAGNKVDKTSVDVSGTDGLLKDIKAEIKAMLQGTFAINRADLFVAVSHTMFDELENEAEVKRRMNDNLNSFNYGFEEIRVSGVPIVASHNVDVHTDGANTVGSQGDVFILNRREARFRSLAPLSTVTLGRVGLSEQAVMFEFGAPIMRGAGKLSRYLSNYPL